MDILLLWKSKTFCFTERKKKIILVVYEYFVTKNGMRKKLLFSKMNSASFSSILLPKFSLGQKMFIFNYTRLSLRLMKILGCQFWFMSDIVICTIKYKLP